MEWMNDWNWLFASCVGSFCSIGLWAFIMTQNAKSCETSDIEFSTVAYANDSKW